jgi:hypothetical protein
MWVEKQDIYLDYPVSNAFHFAVDPCMRLSPDLSLQDARQGFFKYRAIEGDGGGGKE